MLWQGLLSACCQEHSTHASLKPARTCTDSMHRMYAPLLVPRRPHLRRTAQSSAAGRAPWPCFFATCLGHCKGTRARKAQSFLHMCPHRRRSDLTEGRHDANVHFQGHLHLDRCGQSCRNCLVAPTQLTGHVQRGKSRHTYPGSYCYVHTPNHDLQLED